MVTTHERKQSQEMAEGMQVKVSSGSAGREHNGRMAQPVLEQQSREIQSFDTVVRMPLALSEEVCRGSIAALNHLLADSLALRDMYKKHHWQVAGPSFYQLHLLFDKHFAEQVELVDALAERVQMLGGVSIAMAHDVIEESCLPRVPRGREEVPVQIARLLGAHEIILKEAHQAAKAADEAGDDGTNDLLVSEIIRRNEMQAWFLAEHLVEMPLVHAK
jgi:starvation-inducible DNA-binding protein